MAGRIRREDVDAVRERVRIDEVVGEQVVLKSAGVGSLKGLCPFHDERSPSFTVRPGVGRYHCLAGETGVITDEGVIPIQELAGKTARVLVRRPGASSSEWVEAPFMTFGVQPLMKITLSRNGRTKDLFATDEHRWFVTAGAQHVSRKERLTKDLRPGDRLISSYPQNRVKHNVTPSPFGIARGFTYGDGTRVRAGSCANFCGAKDDAMRKWFPLSRVLDAGEGITRAYDLPGYFKSELPSLEESASYLYGWLAGYFAADGCVADDGDATLASADRKSLEHVERVCSRLGIATNEIGTQVRRGKGVVDSEIHTIRILTSDLTEPFFLIDAHRDRFLAAEKKYERRRWVVRSVEWSDRVEEVFCAVVEEAHNFTLAGNILTGNCFGCGEGGDVFDFLIKTTAVTFVEAVEAMAAKVGVALRYEDGGGSRPAQDVGKRQRLLDAHRVAAEFYAERLFSPEAEVGRRFLKDRGFDRAAAEQFGVGYAPTGWGALTDHLRSRGFTSDEIVTGGLAAQGQRGPYDRFRGRLVWPIRDVVGSVIGFGARRLTEDDSGPKYLNTPETPLYRKSHVLYGLDLAKKEIGRRKQVVVVEGYTDVMACHLAGVRTAVATCGTAFGTDHVGVVRRLLGDDDGAGQVVFTFDGDAAGQKAALRAFEHDQEFVAATYVAVEPRGMDPCDLRLADGDEAVVALVEAKRPMFEFAVRSVLSGWDLETAEGRVRALGAAAPVVAGIKDRQLRDEHTRQLARMLGMDLGAVQRAVQTEAHRLGRGGSAGGPVGGAGGRQGAQGQGRGGGQGGGPGGGRGVGRGGPAGERDVVAAAERQLLALVVQAPAVVPPAFDAFVLPPSRAVHEAVRKAGGVAAGRESGVSWVDHLEDAAGEETADQVSSLLGALAVVPLPVDSDAGLARLAQGLLHDVLLREVGRREADLKGRAQRLEAAGEHAAAGEAYAALFALASERQRLRESIQE